MTPEIYHKNPVFSVKLTAGDEAEVCTGGFKVAGAAGSDGSVKPTTLISTVEIYRKAREGMFQAECFAVL